VRAAGGAGRIARMNVKEVMSREVRTVRMVDRLDAAARTMWEHDCGIVPVVDGNQAVVGVLTDRDLCMAGYTQGKLLGEIPVTAVMARTVRTCRPDDAIATALATMQQHQLHRLPVVDARGVAVGVLAMNDLVRLAQARPAAVDAAHVLRTLAAIGAPRKAQAGGAAAPAAKAAAAPAAPAAAPAPTSSTPGGATVTASAATGGATKTAAPAKNGGGKPKGKKG
jgi:CBS domain-containing protein